MAIILNRQFTLFAYEVNVYGRDVYGMDDCRKQGRRLQDIEFPLSFFEDEVRDGFYLSSMMKRYWAAQLTVLAQIARICETHGILWYADCGTLLGAVRHRGFTPWDDDLDICMFRKDLVRFEEAAQKELPNGYQVLNIHTEKEYEYTLTRITNGYGLMVSKEHLNRFYGCPYAAGVDIFPLDGLMADEQKEQQRREQLKTIAHAMDLVDAGRQDTPQCRRLLADIERDQHVALHRRQNLKRELLFLSERLFGAVSTEEAEDVALMPFWVQYGNHRYSKELFQDRIWLPFEHTCISVPARYDEVLRIEYGDYMKPSKDGGIHTYPAFRPLEDAFRKNQGRNPYRYTLTEEEAGHICRVQPLEQAGQMAEMLSQAHCRAAQLADAGQWDVLGQILESCQSVAIALGTELEKRVGEQSDVIRLLEQYCECIYNCFEDFGEDSIPLLDELLGTIRVCIQEMAVHGCGNKKEVVFLPCKAAWWNTMEAVWRAAVEDGDAEVYVIPVPYYERNADGTTGVCRDESGLFPKDVKITPYDEYDFAKHHPDIIVIQNPYDGWNQSMDIPKQFYSSHLRQFTDKLVYLPCFLVDPPSSMEDKAAFALQSFVEQPANVYADQVLLSSDQMRRYYIDTLCLIAGEETRKVWDKKIVAVDGQKNASRYGTRSRSGRLPEAWRQYLSDGSGGFKKLLVYHMTIASLMQYKEKAIQKMEAVFEGIHGNRDRIAVVWIPFEKTASLETLSPQLWSSYREMVGRFEEMKLGIYDAECEMESVLDKADAYYGDASALAYRCMQLQIPVMIQEVTLF